MIKRNWQFSGIKYCACGKDKAADRVFSSICNSSLCQRDALARRLRVKNRVCLLASLMGSLLLTFIFCMTPVQLTEGNSSETVIGRVVNSDGSPACSAIVALYPADYDPMAVSSLLRIPADTTDSSGYYRIAAPDTAKELSIVATSQQSGDLAMLSSIVVRGDATNVPDAVLSVPGAIMVEYRNQRLAVMFTFRIQDITAEVNSSGMILLNNVPAGVLPSVNYNTGTVSGFLSRC